MVLLEQRIHGALERRRGITQPKGHHAVLKGSPPCLKGSLLQMLGENQNLVKTAAQVHFCENGGLPHVVQTFINSGHMVRYLLGQVIEPSTANAHTLCAIMLFGK